MTSESRAQWGRHPKPPTGLPTNLSPLLCVPCTLCLLCSPAEGANYKVEAQFMDSQRLYYSLLP